MIISKGQLGGGSALTARFAAEEGKPWLQVDLEKLDRDGALSSIKRWLRDLSANVLNIAGPRANSDERICRDAYALIVTFLQDMPDGR